MKKVTNHQHFYLYKPFGYLSQFINNGPKQKSKKLLGELYDFPKGAMSVGRLDEKSEGLLIITTNGQVSYDVTSSKFEKEYYAQVSGIINSEAIEQLKNGLEISISGKKYMTKKCHAFLLNNSPAVPKPTQKEREERHGPKSWLSITLTEGKFRQVRKMTAAVGFPTLRLIRVRIGNLYLNDLKIGEVKNLDGIDCLKTTNYPK